MPGAEDGAEGVAPPDNRPVSRADLLQQFVMPGQNIAAHELVIQRPVSNPMLRNSIFAAPTLDLGRPQAMHLMPVYVRRRRCAWPKEVVRLRCGHAVENGAEE